MSQMMWFLTRSSGIVAMVLMVAAVVNGLLFSGRETGKRLRPAWWLDLHHGLGGYALVFTGVHLATAYAADIAVGLAAVFLPGSAPTDTSAFTWGVLAFYALALTVLTSWPKKRLRRKAWHLVHLLSIPAAVLACVHAVQLGSDANAPAFSALLLTVMFTVTFAIGLRVTGMRRARRERSARVPSPPAPAGASLVGRDADDRVLVHSAG